jgi:class 3 adenylate cyclase/predicted ATPase
MLTAMIEVGQLLEELGLGEYAERFADNAIDGDILDELTDDDLKEMGLPVGHRRRLLRAIRDLSAEPGPPHGAGAVDGVRAREADAEHRQLTVMFIDLVGSTELSTQLATEDLRQVIRAYHECCAQVIRRFEGYIAKIMGDGVLAYFGYPRADEADAERAVRAGLALVEAVGRLRPHGDLVLRTRVGISTGDVVVGGLADARDDVVGQTPNRAARLQAIAPVNAVVVGERTRQLAGGLFDYADLGAHAIKGFAEPAAVFQVLGPAATTGRFEALRRSGLTPLVGRDEEIALLLGRWEQAREGEGQVVILAGEPGIGKSRVIEALRERLADRAHHLMRYQCYPYYRNSPFQPVIEELERAAGIVRNDTADIRLAKLEAHLTSLGPRSMAALPLFAELLSIPTGERLPPHGLGRRLRKAKTLEALTDRLHALGARYPMLIVFEDVQWIDPTSQELLERVVDGAGSLRALVVISSRPEAPSLRTTSANVTALTLNRLSRRQASALIERMTGGKTLPGELLEQILAKTDGVPLFVEELTKTVLESGLLTDRGDRYALNGPLPVVAIPATLQDSLRARLDRPGLFKEVAQIAAVIGREFSYDLLAAVAPWPEEQLHATLDQLMAAGLIFRRGEPPDALYTFKHILVQETAYGALLRSRREQLHRQIARALATDFPDVMATRPELIAHHYTEAGENEEAVEYWREAGELAIARGAFHEAVAHLSSALAILARFPETGPRDRIELALQTTLGNALLAARGFAAPETGAAYQRALELSNRLDDRSRLMPALFGRWIYHMARAEVRACLPVADEMLKLAEEQGDTASLLIACRALANSWFFIGDLAAARQYAERAVAAYDPVEHAGLARLYSADPYVMCAFFLAHSLLRLGYPEQAQPWSERGLERARELGDVVTFAHALHHACLFYHLERKPQAVRRTAGDLIAYATEHSLPFWQALGRIFHGAALAELGQTAEGQADLRAGIAAYRATEGILYLLFALPLFAEACRAAGEVEEGLRAIAEAQALVAETGVRGFEVYLHRLEGLLQRDRGNPEQAEACFRRAIDLAHSQGARMTELRAAVNLAGLWHSQGKGEAARTLLAPLYAGFTEGFESEDLKDAMALLDRLAYARADGMPTTR